MHCCARLAQESSTPSIIYELVPLARGSTLLQLPLRSATSTATMSPLLRLFLFLFAVGLINAQNSTDSGYIGYTLESSGSTDDTLYETANTNTNVSTTNPPPDVFLNASVSVDEIDITVTNLSAKVNLDAQVLQLLGFNAGVTASINRVSLVIQNVTAKVILEARLGNVVAMISDVLDSLDLNPVLATLGQDVSSIVNTTAGALTDTTSSLKTRSVQLSNNILYSINDYSGNTHTNRVLSQNGSIIDEFLDNNGEIHSQKVVGYYATDMQFTGFNQTVTHDGEAERELEYMYTPFHGVSVVSAIYTSATGSIVSTQVLSESNAGGSSTVSGEL